MVESIDCLEATIEAVVPDFDLTQKQRFLKELLSFNLVLPAATHAVQHQPRTLSASLQKWLDLQRQYPLPIVIQNEYLRWISDYITDLPSSVYSVNKTLSLPTLVSSFKFDI